MNFFSNLTKRYPYFIAEIGINHNGDMKTAIKLIEAAKLAGCNAVKFQKRTPEICVPKNQWQVVRDTPWGKMTYIKYKKKIEFNLSQYKKLKKYADKLNIDFVVSCWDQEAVNFMQKIKTPFFFRTLLASEKNFFSSTKDKCSINPSALISSTVDSL